MKTHSVIANVFVLFIAIGSFNGCSSTSDKASKDEFFEPVEKVISKRLDTSATQQVFTRERYGVKTDESMKDAIIEMLRMQNRRLEDVVVQLNQITKKEVVDNSAGSENLSNLLSSRDKVTNEMLLEMIREQSQRLNDVIEQLKIISQNQHNQRGTHSNLVARVNAAPVETPPVRKVAPPKSQAIALNYGKAIQLYKTHQYEEAIQAFKSLIARGIDSKLTDNCYFWMGVCYFNQKMGNKAIGAFSEVISYPSSDKTESAYFMIGQTYEQMGAKKFASMTFEKMIKEYPRGVLKQVAEKKLALLK